MKQMTIQTVKLIILGALLSQNLFYYKIVQASDSMVNAQNVINSSLLLAKERANSALSQDFFNVILNITTQAKDGTCQSETTIKNGICENKLNNDAAETLDELEKIALDLESTRLENLELTQQRVEEVWKNYTQIIRHRMASSFKIQNQIYHSNQIFKNLESALESFEAVCKTGRSEACFSPNLNLIPYPEKIDWQVLLGYGFSMNDRKSYSIKIGSVETSDQIGTALNIATSVSGQIVLNGGTGTLVAQASAAFPYFAALAVVYGLVKSYGESEKNIKQMNDIAEANTHILTNRATEKDVARFYKDSCASIDPLIKKMKQTIADLQLNSEKRASLVSEAQKSIEERLVYTKEAQEAKEMSDWLNLYFLAQLGQCSMVSNAAKSTVNSEPVSTSTKDVSKNNNYCSAYSIESEKKSDNLVAACEIKNGFYYSNFNKNIVIEQDLIKSKDLFEAKKKSVQDFENKYSREKKVQFVSDTLIDWLAPEWESTESNLMKFSFEASDRHIQSSYKKLLLILNQYRLEKQQGLLTEEDPFLKDLNRMKEYYQIKDQYKNLMSDATKVAFNLLSRKDFRKKVESFLKRAKPFISLYSLQSNRSLINLNFLIDRFEKIYLKL